MKKMKKFKKWFKKNEEVILLSASLAIKVLIRLLE